MTLHDYIRKYPQGKRCGACGAIKPLTAFRWFRSKGVPYLKWQCRSCDSAEHRQRYHYKRPKLLPFDTHKAFALYRSGSTYVAIAQQLQVSKDRVRRAVITLLKTL